ncbi:MAG: hypothetical protein KAJ19_17750, partial [Gammaproteobacteria bacterium]|nr:hypothetical protein [Gammaproteobacteria bacterium]
IDANAIATDAIGSAEFATTAVNEIRDAILSDSTPFAGANIDAATSTRATPTQVNAEVDQALLDYDSSGGVAKENSVLSIQNNTRFVGIVPVNMLIPDTGDTMYKLTVHFYDTDGNMEDPDSNEIDVLYEDVSGADKDAFFDDAGGTTGATAGVIDANMWQMVRIGVGVYVTYYKLPNTETIDQWTATFKLNESATLLQYSRSTNVVEENPGSVTLADNVANKLVVAEGVLATPANKLATDANGRVDVSLIEGSDATDGLEAAAAAGVLATPANKLAVDASGRIDIGDWAGTAVGVGVTSGLPAVDAQAISDSTAAADNVEANIGNLDAAITTRASVSALATHDGKLDTVDGIVDNILTDTADMQPKLGTPVALDGGSATLGSMLTKIADDNSGLNFDATTDSLHEIASSVSGGDWLAGEKEQIRSALGVDGTKTAATGGQLQSIQTDVNGIETDLADGTYGLSALRTAIDSNATDIAAVQADTDDIQVKIGTPADIDGGGATLANNLKKLADDNGGTTFDATIDSQQAIRASAFNLTTNEFSQMKNALGMDDSGGTPVGGDLQDVEALATAIKAVTDLIPNAGAMTSIAQEATLGTPVGTDLATDIATVLTAVTGVQTEIDDATYGLSALKVLIDAVPTAVLAETVDGSADVQVALTKILAYCAGNIARIGTVYTYQNFDHTADEMTHTATSTTRTRS